MAQSDRLRRGITPEQKQTRNFSVKVPNPLKIREYAQKGKGTVLSETQFNTASGHHEVFFGERTVLHMFDDTTSDILEQKALITANIQVCKGVFISDGEAHEIRAYLKVALGDRETFSYYEKDQRGKQTITIRRNDLYIVVDLGFHNPDSFRESVGEREGIEKRSLKIHLMRFYGPRESQEAFSHLIEADDEKFTEALDFYALFFSAVVNAAYSVKNTPVPHREVVMQVRKA